MSQSAKFWDKIAEKYSKQPIANEEAYQWKLERTREHFTADSEVLEVGCGTGSTAITHAPYVKHILATDISANMLDIARRKAAEQDIPNVTFEQATVEALQAPVNSFDVILALSFLHLVEDKEATMTKLRTMLKPGGVFISSTVCLGDKMWYIKLITPIARAFGFMPLLKVFTQKQLLESLKSTGFEIDYQWTPEKGISTFIIARNPA